MALDVDVDIFNPSMSTWIEYQMVGSAELDDWICEPSRINSYTAAVKIDDL